LPIVSESRRPELALAVVAPGDELRVGSFVSPSREGAVHVAVAGWMSVRAGSTKPSARRLIGWLSRSPSAGAERARSALRGCPNGCPEVVWKDGAEILECGEQSSGVKSSMAVSTDEGYVRQASIPFAEAQW
jgi:hypothetical protein